MGQIEKAIMKISVLRLRRHSYAEREKSSVGISITTWIRPGVASRKQACCDHKGVVMRCGKTECQNVMQPFKGKQPCDD